VSDIITTDEQGKISGTIFFSFSDANTTTESTISSVLVALNLQDNIIITEQVRL
jgi:hypothetical protein